MLTLTKDFGVVQIAGILRSTDRKCNCDCTSTTCGAADKYVEQLEEVFNYTFPQKKVAGMFLESIQVLNAIAADFFKFFSSFLGTSAQNMLFVIGMRRVLAASFNSKRFCQESF